MVRAAVYVRVFVFSVLERGDGGRSVLGVCVGDGRIKRGTRARRLRLGVATEGRARIRVAVHRKSEKKAWASGLGLRSKRSERKTV
eukprot:3141684-Rhodomonas_salina.1